MIENERHNRWTQISQISELEKPITRTRTRTRQKLLLQKISKKTTFSLIKSSKSHIVNFISYFPLRNQIYLLRIRWKILKIKFYYFPKKGTNNWCHLQAKPGGATALHLAVGDFADCAVHNIARSKWKYV